MHDYNIDDIERDLDRLDRMINEDKLHNVANWMTQLREILMNLRAKKIRDIDIMKEYDRILRSLEPYEYIIVSRAVVRLMGNRTRELLEDPELYRRLRYTYLKLRRVRKDG